MALNGGDYLTPQNWVTSTAATNTVTWNGSYVYPNTFTVSGGSGYTVGSGGGGSGGYITPAPRTPTALEWLDAEIEAVCRLARVS